MPSPDPVEYMVNVQEVSNSKIVFTLVPRLQVPPGSTSTGPPQYIIRADKGEEANWNLTWSDRSDAPGGLRNQIENIVCERLAARDGWIQRIRDFVLRIEGWAAELGWTTRRISKRLDDHRIGKHTVEALLMQDETCRVLLEPVARTAPGTEGVVDLYLMPAYDDIASFYFDGATWNLQYPFSNESGESGASRAVAISKEEIEKVLTEMKLHAASA